MLPDQNLNFKFQLKKKRPLWKDLLLLCVSVGSFWGSAHIALNYSAYSQIATHRWETFTTNLFEGNSASAAPKAAIQNTPFETRIRTVDPLMKIDVPRENLFQNAQLKPKNQVKEVFENMPIYPSDNRLYIPSLNKNVPLITVPHNKNWNQLENNIQSGLRDGVVVHPVSREPFKNGNFFITGHSSYYAWDDGRFKDVFALLHEMNTNEIVELFWEGKKYTYLIKAKQVVPPTATQILRQPSDAKLITLMTCTPIGTNKDRLVLIGEQIENEKQS